MNNLKNLTFKPSIFINKLKAAYPEATCSLDFKTPFELVVAVMLSAQCTDERVNLVTPKLFSRCPNISDYRDMPISELEDLIHSCGFYSTKAKHIQECSNCIIEQFNGIVPNDMDKLLSLPGIGRKSANVICLEVFNNPQGIAVDTHAKRLSNLIGFSNQTDPNKIEQELLQIFPKKYLKDINHLFMWHGRYTCIARNPKCDTCCVNKFCNHYNSKLD